MVRAPVEHIVVPLDVTDTAAFDEAVFDTITVAYLLDESIVTDSIEVHLDVDAQFGPDYGRSLGHAKNPPVGTQPATVVRRIDLDRFWDMYADLLGRLIE